MKIYELFVKCEGGHTSSITYTNKQTKASKICPKCGIIINKQLTNKHKTTKHEKINYSL